MLLARKPAEPSAYVRKVKQGEAKRDAER